MPHRDPAIVAGGVGFIASITLADLSAVVSLLVGVATLGFVVTRWALYLKANGGLAALFSSARPPSPSPAPAARPCADCPAKTDPREA